MSQLKWDDDLKYSILQLKMNLSAKDFKLAGPAIGLENSKLVTEHKIKSKKNKKIEQNGFSQDRPSASPEHRPSKVSPKLQTPHDTFTRFIVVSALAHVIDMCFVLISMFIVLFAAGLIIDPHGISSDLATLRLWWPLQLLRDFGIQYFLIGSYLAFFAYWFVFKVLVGSTPSSIFVVRNNPYTDTFLEQ